MNPYIQDILAQPAALRRAAALLDPEPLAQVRQGLQSGLFDRIIMTGMGASYNAAYPAYLRLSQLPVPVMLVNTAELLHYLTPSIGERTLLWMNSQSGRSAELVSLLDATKTRPPALTLACVNDLASPLAESADIALPIFAGPETTVSTKTYTNMLAINLLSAVEILGGNLAGARQELNLAADAIAAYLADWQGKVSELNAMLEDPDVFMILGRGDSMAAVWNGSLICKEAAKASFEGMQAADFRHGPLELVKPGFAALVFAGPQKTRPLNRDLALEINDFGGRALWVDREADPELPTLLIPPTGKLARPLAEILPMEMLTLVMASRKGIPAGQFRHINKVTLKE